MNEAPPQSSKPLWPRPVKALVWWASLSIAIFVVIGVFDLLSGHPDRVGELTPVALIVSLILAAVLTLALPLFRWLFSWRNLRRGLFAVACLIVLIALAYAEENWRGRHAWLKHRAECEAKGEKLSIAELAPPPVPDEKNFALTPLLAATLDFTQGPGGLVWRDTNGLARLDKASAELVSQHQDYGHLVLGSLEKGTFADLPACAGFSGATRITRKPRHQRRRQKRFWWRWENANPSSTSCTRRPARDPIRASRSNMSTNLPGASCCHTWRE